MKPIPAIVESEHEAAFAAVRATYSAVREADVQVERTTKREADAIRIAGAARNSAHEKRVECGKALLCARRAWPERGPNAKGWGEFLKREGIDDSTAFRYMQLARDTGGDFTQNERLSEIPHPSELPDARTDGPAPSSRKPLGLLADMQLYLGRWEDILADVGTVDTVITDPPYSARTHSGSRTTRSDDSDPDGLSPNYDPWGLDEIDRFVGHWHPRTRGWIVALCDDELIPIYRARFEHYGRFAFAPVPCVIYGMTVRARGDGPSSWAVYAMVARPRTAEFVNWGTLPGAYVGNTDHGSKHGRGKPRWLTDGFVQHYTREGDLVCDPLAGYGGTLVSALLQRRRAVGAESDEAAVKEGFSRADAINEPTTILEPTIEPTTESAA